MKATGSIRSRPRGGALAAAILLVASCASGDGPGRASPPSETADAADGEAGRTLAPDGQVERWGDVRGGGEGTVAGPGVDAASADRGDPGVADAEVAAGDAVGGTGPTTPDALSSTDGAAPDPDLPLKGPDLGPDNGVGGSTLCAARLSAELAPLIDGLLYMSESDEPFEVVAAPGAGTGPIIPDELVAALGLDPTLQAEVWTFEDFFDPWLLEDEQDGARYVAIRDLLLAHLDERTVIRLGAVEVQVYVVGRTACGEIAGLRTMSVET